MSNNFFKNNNSVSDINSKIDKETESHHNNLPELAIPDNIHLTDVQEKIAKILVERFNDLSNSSSGKSISELIYTEDDYIALSKCETKEHFNDFIQYIIKKNRYEKVTGALSSINILNDAKNPLELTVDDIDTVLGYKSPEELSRESEVVAKKMKSEIMNAETEKYVTKRNRRNPDGSLDRMINLDELSSLERTTQKIYKDTASNVDNNDKLGGVVYALNDMGVDVKRTYEILKMHYCNTWGLTPESVDQFLVQMFNDRTAWLDSHEITSRKQIGSGEEFTETMKNNILKYCKKIPGWKPGDVVYRSKFVEYLDKTEDARFNEAMRNSKEDASIEIGKGLVELWDTRKLKPRNEMKKKENIEKSAAFLDRRKRKASSITSIVENAKVLEKIDEPVKVSEEVTTNNKIENLSPVVQPQHKEVTKHENSAIMRAVKYKKPEILEPEQVEEMIQEAKHHIEEEPEVIQPVPPVQEVKEEVIPEIKEEETPVEPVTTKENHDKTDALISELMKMGYVRAEAEKVARRCLGVVKELDEDLPVKSAEEPQNGSGEEIEHVLNSKSEEIPKEPVNSPRTFNNEYLVGPKPKTNVDDYTKTYDTPANTKILSTVSDRMTRLKLYRESKKKGRVLYLINSNYEVYVNKLYNRNHISYILQLLQDGAVKDINLVDSFVKKEVLRIVYECIDFDFDVHPTYDEFIECLSESDLTVLMMMVAIVNIPEDSEGRIPLLVHSVQCTNCGSIGMLKEPIKIDLKEEFTRVYDIDAFSIKYNEYKSRGYKTIQDAYYATNEAVSHTISEEGDIFEYEIVLSAPTVKKTQLIRDLSDGSSYKKLVEVLKERSEAITKEYDMQDIIDYISSHSYQEYRYRAVSLQDAIMDKGGEDKLSPEEREELIKIGRIGIELNNAISNDSIFNVLIDVIDGIKIKDRETGEEVVGYVTLNDHYDLLNIVKQSPNSMMKLITEAKQKYINSIISTDLEFTSEELAGKFDFESQYKSESEFITDIKIKRKDLSPTELDRYITEQVELRSKLKDNYDKYSVCICENTKWKLNYTNILFFYAWNL